MSNATQTVYLDPKNILEESYEVAKRQYGASMTRLEFLSERIFDFVLGDSAKAKLFGRKAVEFINAVNTRTTFEYFSESDENYNWYLIMANMPYFTKNLSWGTSVRQAWWESSSIGEDVIIPGGDFWFQGQQLLNIQLTTEGWEALMEAMVVFAQPEMSA